MSSSRTAANLAEHLVAWLTLALLLLYTYGNFLALPYTGLYFIEASGRVVRVYQPGPVLPEDEIVQIGAVRLADFRVDAAPRPFSGYQPGDRVPIELIRAGQTLTVDWTLPGYNWPEFFNLRLTNQWWISYVFWAIGALTVLGLRPRRRLQRLFAAFNFLTALWIIASVVSRWHWGFSPEVLRSAIWLSLPVYWHLHWVFPEPLRPLPRWLGLGVYALAGLAALAEWLRLMPPNLYTYALLAAPLGSLVLLLAHLAFQKRTRRAAATLLFGAVLSLVPGILIGISSGLLGLGSELALGGLMGLPMLPLAYLLAIYRHRFGGLELRVNRAVSIYLFLLVVLIGLVLVGGAIEASPTGTPEGLVVVLVFAAGLVAVLAAIVGFGPFQRWVERRVLGVPPAPTGLVQTYAGRIGTSLEQPTLVRLLRDEVLPALLVRQSALVSQDADGGWRVLYAAGVSADALPADAAALLAAAGRYRPPTADTGPAAWVRLPLRLQVPGQRPGLWLLGRRDPDDFYAASELPVLQTLADQTAVALLNIRQAEDLHALYQANVERAETERSHLARELHDGPLNEFGRLANKVEGDRLAPDFQATYATAVAGLRRTIAGLRPIMLSYGLPSGLRSLVSDLGDQWPAGPEVQLETPLEPCRYSEQVETHAYRIVQQACINALRHAGARTIRLHGTFDPDRLDLTVEDDGRGFEIGADFTAWLAQRHFGLAGMRERAALIGGELHIHSAPGAGTRLRLVWPANGSA